ncbi:MAG: hypothetical protein RIK87_29910 [Fuerstiella sp.]
MSEPSSKLRIFVSSVQQDLENEPLLSTNSGCFEITFPGPGEDLNRLRVPEEAIGAVIEPSVAAELTTRQKEMVALLRQGVELTSRFCEQRFEVSRDSTSRDFKALVKHGLAVRVGAGRSTLYVLPEVT